MPRLLDFDPPLDPSDPEVASSDGSGRRARSVGTVARLSMFPPDEPVADATSHGVRRLLQHVQRQPDMRLPERDAAETFGRQVVRRGLACGLIDVDANSETFWVEPRLCLTLEGQAWLNRQRLLSALAKPFRAVRRAGLALGDLYPRRARS